MKYRSLTCILLLGAFQLLGCRSQQSVFLFSNAKLNKGQEQPLRTDVEISTRCAVSDMGDKSTNPQSVITLGESEQAGNAAAIKQREKVRCVGPAAQRVATKLPQARAQTLKRIRSRLILGTLMKHNLRANDLDFESLEFPIDCIFIGLAALLFAFFFWLFSASAAGYLAIIGLVALFLGLSILFFPLLKKDNMK